MSQIETIEQAKELTQESKYIKIDEFMPKWTQAQEIKEEKDRNAQTDFEQENGISITDGKCCMIGEAHGGGDDYYEKCDECHKFSLGRYRHEMFGDYKEISAISAHNGTLREFYQFKEKVYNHFMETHPEKLLRK